MQYVTAAGQRLKLADAPFASGGEGGLHDIIGKRTYVAKLYRDPALARERERKIRAMVELPGVVALPANMAWPQTLLFDEAGTFAGFVMKRVGASLSLCDVYKYPGSKVTQAQRLKIAISLAETFAALHAAGQAVGDGNPDNIRVLPDCTVTLLDCDSFAVRSRDATLFRCEMCAQGYAAPEMLKATQGGLRYRDVARTFDEGTDRYVLALHIARLLRNGAHPNWYARDSALPGNVSLQLPSLDECARLGETPLFIAKPGMVEPLFAPAFDTFPRYLQLAFKQTLVQGHDHPEQRIAAYQWATLLKRYASEIEVCQADPAHVHLRGRACPYCEADARMGRGKKSGSAAASVARNASCATASAAAAIASPAGAANPAASTVLSRTPPIAIPGASPWRSALSAVKAFFGAHVPGSFAVLVAIVLSVSICYAAVTSDLFLRCAAPLVGMPGDAERFFCALPGFAWGVWRARALRAAPWPRLVAEVAFGTLAGIAIAIVIGAAFVFLLDVTDVLELFA